ncbi:hypothetical protein OE131_30125 (plasmid) [Klebsiella pneumoniae]|nr:hypothetical protein [Klebsiella pneumoniae]UYD13821.1 hypothetical protein OE131_30125 [Klebsiella pneumoniae]
MVMKILDLVAANYAHAGTLMRLAKLRGMLGKPKAHQMLIIV